jgi:hypothetical protein
MLFNDAVSAAVDIILPFIYRLFNDAISSSDYIALNDTNNDLERVWK